MGSVPSEYCRERAVSLDVQIGSKCARFAAVSTAVCLPYFIFHVLRQTAFICSGLFLCQSFQNTSDRYTSSSYKAGPGRGAGSEKCNEISKGCMFRGSVQQDQLCEFSLWHPGSWVSSLHLFLWRLVGSRGEGVVHVGLSADL